LSLAIVACFSASAAALLAAFFAESQNPGIVLLPV
jgi:hypothetical protein